MLSAGFKISARPKGGTNRISTTRVQSNSERAYNNKTKKVSLCFNAFVVTNFLIINDATPPLTAGLEYIANATTVFVKLCSAYACRLSFGGVGCKITVPIESKDEAAALRPRSDSTGKRQSSSEAGTDIASLSRGSTTDASR